MKPGSHRRKFLATQPLGAPVPVTSAGVRRAHVFVLAFASTALLMSCSDVRDGQPFALQQSLTSAPVAHDADDPAIWIDRAVPSRSLIIATDKAAAPDGALWVFGLDGAVRQVVKPLDRPNNVDVEYGLPTPRGSIDIVVATERYRRRLRVYSITAEGLTAIDGGGVPVLEGEHGEMAMPMGIGLYRRPRDGAIFAIVAPKSGSATDYLWQYRLTFDGESGVVRGARVRRFGNFSGVGEIEAVAVDDELGYVYYADEEYGLRKWHADPDSPEAHRELAVFGRAGFRQQREGIAVVGRPDGTGFVVATDQIPGSSVLHAFRREGQPGRPHDHEPAVAMIPTTSDDTDGIDAAATALGTGFPEGLLVMMNSSGRNFHFYDFGTVRNLIAGSVRGACR